VDPDTLSVCVRGSHVGGSFNTALPMLTAEPRSTVSDCGNAPFALSQYVDGLLSTALAGT
jgi:hypothetical protein